MSYPVFSTDYANILQETISKLSYPEIIHLCAVNREINNYCKNNYQTLIVPKRKQHIRNLTDQLIQQTGNQYNAFVTASGNGDINLVRELLNHNLNLNYIGPVALRAANENNREAVVQLLLDNSIIFNALTKSQKMYYALRER